MIQTLTKKVRDWADTDHTDCGPSQLVGHFLNAYDIVRDMSVASVMAAVPCAKQTAKKL